MLDFLKVVPIISSTYDPKGPILRGKHSSTIWPTLLGKAKIQNFERDQFILQDGTEIVVDWLRNPGNSKILVITPGLEGHSRRVYTSHTAQSAHMQGWDVLLLNYRGLEGGINPVPKTYHGGAIHDLHEILLSVASSTNPYDSMALCGFSLGGNIVLNYLGNPTLNKPPIISKAICFSVPCDFTSSSPLLSSGFNHWVYGRRFVKSLKDKVLAEAALFEGLFDRDKLHDVKTLEDFDEVFTSRVNGFLDGQDYYKKVSSLIYLENISTPTLLVNAANDPMLSNACYPKEIAGRSIAFHLEVPKYGGHVGFAMNGRFSDFYYAKRTATWLAN